MTAIQMKPTKPSLGGGRRWLLAGGALAASAAVVAGGLFAIDALNGGGDTPAASTASSSRLTSTTPAIEQLLGKIERDPRDVESMTRLADLYLQRVRETGDPALYGSAAAVLKRAAGLEPQNPDVAASQASLALGLHEFREALTHAQRAVELDPERARYYGLRADAEIELGMYDEAVKSLQEMVDRRPDFASFTRIAYARELYGDPEGAIQAMEEAITAGTGISENLAWAYTELGRLYFGFARYEDADAAHDAALKVLPGYHLALAGKGQSAAGRGDFAAAKQHYQDAFDRVPLPAYAIALGDIAARTGDAAGADRQYALVATIDQLFVANGANTDLEIALFQANRELDPAGTVARARAAYEARPSIHAAEVLGWALFRAGEIEEAARYAEESLKLGTLDPMKLYRAGVIQAGRGEVEAARYLLSEAIRINPNFAILEAPAAAAALAALPPAP